jgi:histidyl-tRNA synthetase
LLQTLREAGVRTDYSLGTAKVAKQFHAAEALGAKFAVVVGTEWPQVTLKKLATRSESTCLWEELPAQLAGK